jgi:hypothetical protein
MAVGWLKNRGRGRALAGCGLGLLPPPRRQAKTIREKDFKIPGLQREIPSRSLPPLGRFAKEIRERERRDWQRLG